MLQRLLSRLETAEEPVALVIVDTTKQLLDAHERRALAQNYANNLQERDISYAFTSYAASLAEKNKKLLRKNHWDETKIHIIFQESSDFRDVPRINESFGYQCGPPGHPKLAEFFGFRTIVELESQPHLFEQRFKQKSSPFRKRLIAGNCLMIRLIDFLALIDRQIETVARIADPPFRAFVEELIQQLRDYRAGLADYCGLFSNDQNELLLDIYCKVIAQKNSLVNAYYDFFSHLRTPYPNLTEFEALQLIARTSNRYKNTLYLDHGSVITKIGTYLQSDGFSMFLKGRVSFLGETVADDDRPIKGAVMQLSNEDMEACALPGGAFELDPLKFAILTHKRSHKPGIFDNDELLGFLDTVFTKHDKESLPDDGSDEQKSNEPVSPEIARNVSSLTINQDTLQFLNPMTLTKQKETFFDHNLVECSQCGRYVAKKDVKIPSKDTVCSAHCFAKKLISAVPELAQLLEPATPLTAEQISFLKRCAALCFYQSITLTPGILLSKNYFFHLLHENIAQKFSTLAALGTDHRWARTTDCLKKIGVRIQNLSLWIAVFTRAKQAYRSDFLALIKGRSYKEIKELTNAPLFDSKGGLKKQQTAQLAYLKEFHELQNLKHDELMALIYKHVVKEIVKKLGLSTLDFEKELTFEKVITIEMGEKEGTKLEQLAAKTEQLITVSKPSSLLDSSSDDEDEMGLVDVPPVTKASASRDSASRDSEDFKLRPEKKPSWHKEIIDRLGDREQYSIQLYKVRSYFDFKHQSAAIRALLKPDAWTYSYRVGVLFELAQSLADKGSTVIRDQYHMPVISYTAEDCEASIGSRLNINHLFSQQIDQYLESYGIYEELDNLIQVSIPGEIIDGLQNKTIGFFQYSFRKSDCVCIHRCFVRYDSQSHGNKFISHALRTSLQQFLKHHLEELQKEGDQAYTQVVERLNVLTS